MVAGSNSPTFAVLGSDGTVLHSGGDINSRQDPASTTKLWTLYTIMAMVRDGHLPESFMTEHRSDLQNMMIYSNNQASERLARAADRATGGDGSVSNGQLDAVPGFAEWMNRYASGDLSQGRLALENTNFITASGMPHQQHYSTARDMALMTLRFRTDFEGSSVAEHISLAGMSGSTTRAGNGTEYSKTGTATGHHGSTGRYSFVGATNDGVYAVAGAATEGDRAQLVRRLAERTHDSEVSFDDLDLVNPSTYLRASEDDNAREEAARRRQAAEEHNEFSDPDAIQNTLFVAILGIILNIFGFETPELAEPEATPEPQQQSTPPPAEPSSPIAPQVTSLAGNYTIPEGGAETEGRHRLVVLRTDNDASDQHATGEMALVNAAGDIVWRANVASGAESRGNGSLPGMGENLGRAITTTYPIDYNDIRLNRTDERGMAGMSYTDGTPGYSFTLQNPANLNEIGGQGRDNFRIHPAGTSADGSLGCVEFPSDADARSFLATMQALPENQRPYGLEVLSRENLQRTNTGVNAGMQLASAGVSADSTSAPDTSDPLGAARLAAGPIRGEASPSRNA